MPKFSFHMGVDARVYGHVRDVEADTLDAAVALLTPDYVAENFEEGETTTDVVSDLTIIDVEDEFGKTLMGYAGYDIPDPVAATTPAQQEAFIRADQALFDAAEDMEKVLRDLVTAWSTPGGRIVDAQAVVARAEAILAKIDAL